MEAFPSASPLRRQITEDFSYVFIGFEKNTEDASSISRHFRQDTEHFSSVVLVQAGKYGIFSCRSYPPEVNYGRKAFSSYP